MNKKLIKAINNIRNATDIARIDIKKQEKKLRKDLEAIVDKSVPSFYGAGDIAREDLVYELKASIGMNIDAYLIKKPKFAYNPKLIKNLIKK